MPKGSSFERSVCKTLSRWWSKGTRDDIFWRSSQSGGRATQRAKKGKRTFGSYGDVAAVDPIGQPLMRMFTIELKRGRSHGFPGDLTDLPSSPRVQRPFEQALEQAMRSAKQAGSVSWLLISRRDRRIAMVFGELIVLRQFEGLTKSFVVRYDLKLRLFDTVQRLCFVGMPLRTFLARVSPKQVSNRNLMLALTR